MPWDGEVVPALEEHVDEASEVMFWKRLSTSNLGAFGVHIEPDVDVTVDDEEADDVKSAREDDDAHVVAYGGIPIPSDWIVGAGMGEDEMGALASSMGLKATSPSLSMDLSASRVRRSSSSCRSMIPRSSKGFNAPMTMSSRQ